MTHSRRWRSAAAALALAAGAAYLVASGYGILDPPGAVARQILVPGASVDSLAWSPDGRTLAAGISRGIPGPGGPGSSSKPEVQLWDVAEGSWRLVLRGHSNPVTALAFRPDGRTLVTGSRSQVKVWDARSGSLRQTLPAPGRAAAILFGFSPDGALAATSTSSGLEVWNVDRGAPVWTLRAESNESVLYRTLGVVFSPDQRVLAAGNFAGLGFWELRGAHLAPQLRSVLKGQGSLAPVAFSGDGRLLAASAGSGSAMIWRIGEDGAAQPAPRTLGRRGWNLCALALSADGRLLSGVARQAPQRGADDEICVWELPSGRLQRPLAGHEGRVTAIAFSPDGRTLTSGGADGTIRLWNMRRR